MEIKKREKKPELGTKINLGAIVKKADEKRGGQEEIENPQEKKEKFYNIIIKTPKEVMLKFRALNYKIVKKLEIEKKINVPLTNRNNIFIALLQDMDEKIQEDISQYEWLYDKFIARKGKRNFTEKSVSEKDKINCNWGKLTEEQNRLFKRVLTKMGIREGVEKREDFSKQYFIADMIEYLENHLDDVVLKLKK